MLARGRTAARVTALAPTALEAEIRAKAAILSGPDRARGWLPDGGVVVADDGGFEVLAPAARSGPTATAARGSAAARPPPAARSPPCAR